MSLQPYISQRVLEECRVGSGDLETGKGYIKNGKICFAIRGFTPVVKIRNKSGSCIFRKFVKKIPTSVTYYGTLGEYLILKRTVFDGGRVERIWYKVTPVTSLQDFNRKVHDIEDKPDDKPDLMNRSRPEGYDAKTVCQQIKFVGRKKRRCPFCGDKNMVKIEFASGGVYGFCNSCGEYYEGSASEQELNYTKETNFNRWTELEVE